jgi:hypothetical protein
MAAGARGRTKRVRAGRGRAYFGYGVDADTGLLPIWLPYACWPPGTTNGSKTFTFQLSCPTGQRQAPPAPSPTNRPADVVIVSSGWGDGLPTFIGYTAEGDVSSFVTDFVVVPWVIA